MDSPPTLIIDACVLYSAPVRDLLVRLAQAGLIQARWTAEIHEEWMRNLLKNNLIAHLLDIAPAAVVAAVKSQREGLKNPPRTADELLATLELQGLHRTVAALRQFAELI